MGFADAVRTCLSKYASATGRARRSEYWWFALFGFLVGLAAAVLDGVLGTGFLYILSTLALLLPSITVGIRRLHDTDRSGWWLLIGLIPLIGTVILIVFFVMEGTRGPNQHGPDPKQEPAAAY